MGRFQRRFQRRYDHGEASRHVAEKFSEDVQEGRESPARQESLVRYARRNQAVKAWVKSAAAWLGWLAAVAQAVYHALP